MFRKKLHNTGFFCFYAFNNIPLENPSAVFVYQTGILAYGFPIYLVHFHALGIRVITADKSI